MNLKSSNHDKKNYLMAVIQSLQEYLIFKIAVNQLGLNRAASVNYSNFYISQLLFECLKVNLQLQSLTQQQKNSFQNQLKQSNIPFSYEFGENEQTTSLQQFNLAVFRGFGKFSLLRTDYFGPITSKIRDHLFLEDQIFKIEKFWQHDDYLFSKQKDQDGSCNLERSRSWVVIKDKRNRQDDKVQFSCDSLIKINKQVIVNIHKLYGLIKERQKSYFKPNLFQNIYQFIITFNEWIKLGNSLEKKNLYIQFQFNLIFKMKLTFNNCQSLMDFIKNMFRQQLEESLEWSFIEPAKNHEYSFIDLKNHLFSDLAKRIKQSQESGNGLSQLFDLRRIQQFKHQQPQSIYNYMRNCEFHKDETLIGQKNQNNQVSAEKIKQIKHKIISEDILSFQKYWPQLENQFDTILQSWNMYKYDIQDQLRKIINILQYRMQKFQTQYLVITSKSQDEKTPKQKPKFSLYKYLFDKIQFYLAQFKSKLPKKLKNDRLTEKEKEMHILDRLLFNYFQEINLLNSGQGSLTISVSGLQSRPLKEFLADLLMYQHDVADWQDVINVITINTKKIINRFAKASSLVENDFERMIAKLPFHPFPTSSCLACTEFFYIKTSIPRPQDTIIRIIPFASKIKDYESAIKEAICGMLNNKGGIILFDCFKEYASIYPNGALITERDKQAYENQIKNLLNFVYPKPEISNSVIISFVPIIMHPLKAEQRQRKLMQYTGQDLLLKPSQYYYDQLYVQGLFVMRIKVCPTDISKVYIWKSEEQVYHLSGFKNEKNAIRLSGIRKAIKKNMKKYQIATKQIYMPQKFFSPLNHICKTPNSGVKISERQEQAPKVSYTLEQTYKYISMIVIRSRYVAFARQMLTRMGIKCHIETKFSHYNFKVSQNTAVLYHDVSFDRILNAISFNKNFQIEGKPTLAIFVTDYIKLTQCFEANRITYQNLIKIQGWLRQEFPRERLRFFQFRNKQNKYAKEYFLKTQSKLSTLFIYYVLNEFKNKAVFKNPKELDRMTQEERQLNFTQIQQFQSQSYDKQQLNSTNSQHQKNNNDLYI